MFAYLHLQNTDLMIKISVSKYSTQFLHFCCNVTRVFCGAHLHLLACGPSGHSAYCTGGESMAAPRVNYSLAPAP